MSYVGYPDAALLDICNRLLDDWELTQEQINNLAADLAGECQAMRKTRDEAAS